MKACGKRLYRDKMAALFAMSQVRDDAGRPKVEHSAYYCPSCRGWHLTAKR